jgi:hypothetical protein
MASLVDGMWEVDDPGASRRPDRLELIGRESAQIFEDDFSLFALESFHQAVHFW